MSSKPTAIEVTGVSKHFDIYRSPWDRWRELLTGRLFHQEFCAVNDVSFSVPKAETVGIIGQNGSGKSTLLKLLARLMLPSRGTIATEGRISSLIELGTGFHREFSGRANVYLNASLLGLSRAEIDARLPGLIEFSGLGEFIDRPLKTYSSGMWVRLAFSIAININPTILLIDEALAVGDILFQQKCLRRLREFQESGVTIVFVSHDLNAIKMLCQRALLLENGTLVYQGSPDDATEFYLQRLSRQGADRSQLDLRTVEVGGRSYNKNYRRYGTREAEITAFGMTDEDGRPVTKALTGRTCVFDLEVVINQDIDELTAGILIKDRFGNEMFGTNSHYHRVTMAQLVAGRQFVVAFRINLALAPGPYFVTASLHSGRTHFEKCYDWVDNISHFEILPHGYEFIGVANLPTQITVKSKAGNQTGNESGPPEESRAL